YLSAKFKSVLAAQIGDKVAPLPDAVRSLKLGPVHATAERVERSDIDLWHAKALWVSHTGVNAVSTRGNVVVYSEVGLVIVDVTKARLIDPARIRSPGPASS